MASQLVVFSQRGSKPQGRTSGHAAHAVKMKKQGMQRERERDVGVYNKYFCASVYMIYIYIYIYLCLSTYLRLCVYVYEM